MVVKLTFYVSPNMVNIVMFDLRYNEWTVFPFDTVVEINSGRRFNHARELYLILQISCSEIIYLVAQLLRSVRTRLLLYFFVNKITRWQSVIGSLGMISARIRLHAC